MSKPTPLKTLLTWLLPVVVLTLGLLVLLQLRDMIARQPAQTPTRPAADARRHDEPMANLTDLPQLAAAQGQPLASEPADLPAPPGGANLSRWQRPSGEAAEAYSVWQVEGKNAAGLASFYVEAAAERGFTLADRQDEPARGVIRLAFTRAGETLGVRLHETGRSARVVIRLGYTKPNRDRPETPPEAKHP